MGENFLININCSKILGSGDETQYTMFIDTTKMSIVYELVEWIRWLFSLENCFYITHDDSVIHELEDIQLLSRLKTFEVKPCGRPNCVHKRMYRILLKNLELFAHWNNTKVHKFFLHKLNQVDKKLTQEYCKASPTVFSLHTEGIQNFMTCKRTKIDNTSTVGAEFNDFLCKNQVPDLTKDNTSPCKKRTLADNCEANWGTDVKSPNEMNSSIDNNIMLNGNFFTNSNDKFSSSKDPSSEVTENLSSEVKKDMKSNIINNIIRSKLQTEQEYNKSSLKPGPKKYVKPFSVGEILSSIREDFKNLNKEPNSLLLREGDIDIKTGEENSVLTDLTSGEKKRHRTRRRKKTKKDLEEEYISSFIDNTKNKGGSDIKLDTGLKPNHIRFNSTDMDNLMETECVEEKLDENKFGTHDSNALTFLDNKPKEIMTLMNSSGSNFPEALHVNSGMNYADNKMDCSPLVDGKFLDNQKFIDLNDQGCENINECSPTENFESKSLNPNLNVLLYLKEKFKKAVVVERFY